MAGSQGRIDFEVGLNLNSASFAKLQGELTKVINLANNANASPKQTLSKDLEQAAEAAKNLQDILDKSYNKDLGTINISKFNSLLRESNTSVSQLQSELTRGGSAGSAAFARLTSSILNTNVQLKQSSKLLNDMATTMVNTMKWGVASSALNTISGSIRNAYTYTKQLDTALTDIRIVTGDSSENMAQFAEQANNVAKALGSNTLDYAKTALGYYQQGLGDQEVASRTEATIKAANVTGTQAAQVAEYLTAVWNGFQVGIGEETAYVDKLAAVADSSASNLAELATAMSKVASIANNMGVDMDQLNAQIATIIATTRQAPETVGNALKTIYARINDIKTGSDEAEISLGNYTGKMASLGIQVLDSTGHLRDTGEVMEEVGEKWGDMGREQQIYLAQTMAGQRQMNNLIALFDNWDQYVNMLNVSLNAQGTLEEKNARYLESTQAHLNTLKSTWQDLYSTLLNSNEINAGIDTITNLVTVIDQALEGFGGGIKSLTALGAVGAYVFRDQIGRGIGNLINNQTIAKNNFEQMTTQLQAINAQQGIGTTPNDKGAIAAAESQQANAAKMYAVQQGLTQEQQKELILMQSKIGVLTEEVVKQDAIKQAILETSGLKDLQVTAEKGYVTLLSEEIAQRMGLVANEEDLLAILKNRYQQIDQMITTAEQENLAEENINKLLEQREILLNDINRLRAAGRADEAAALSGNAANERDQLQANYDKQIAYAQTIALAKAKTDALTGSLTTLTMGLGMASSAFQTLTNENASFGQKVVQLTMTFGMMGPMLAKSFAVAKAGMAGWTSEIIAGVIATDAQTAENVKNAISQEAVAKAVKDKIISQALANKVTEENIAALTAEEILALRNAGALELNNSSILRSIAARQVHVPAIVAETLALEGETVALGSLLVALAPYAVIIGGIAVAIYSLVQARNADANAAREATEVAKSAAEETEKLKNSYEELGTALDALKDKQNALNGLEKGTREWKAAVVDLNQEILKLLQLYPQLAQYITNEDGILSIDPKGYDAILDAQLTKYQSAADASVMLQGKASMAQTKADARELADKDISTAVFSSSRMLEIAQAYADHMGEIGTADNAGAEFAKYAHISEYQANALLENTDALIALTSSADDAKNIMDNSITSALQDENKYQKADNEQKQYIEQAYTDAWNKISNTSAGIGDDIYNMRGEVAATISKEKLAGILQELTGITYTAEELENITKEQLAEEVVNARKKLALEEKLPEIYQKADQLAKEAADHIPTYAEKIKEAYEKEQNKFAPVEQTADTETYADQAKIIAGLSDSGTLSAEDGATIAGLLSANGLKMDDYFTQMTDGTFQLIGDAKEFQELANNLTLEPFKKQIQAVQEQINAYEGITNLGKEGITSRQWNNPEGQQAQLDYLTATGKADTEFVGELQHLLDSGRTLNSDQVKELADACRNLVGEYDNVVAQERAVKQANAETQQQLANGAQSIEELNNQLTQGLITQDQYNEALLAHGANQDVNAEKVREYTELLAEEADTLDWVDDSLEDNEEAATGVAAAYEDAIEGVEAIQDAWDDWNETGLETPEVVEEITDVLEDMLNTDIPDGFVTDHLDEIQRLAEGDMTALDDLRVSLASLTTEDIEINPDVNLSTDQFEIQKQSFLNEIANTDWGTITIGSDIDDAPFYAALNSMIQNSNMSRDQINTLLSQIGYVPNIKYITIPANHQVASQNGNTYTYEVEGLNGETQTVTLTENLANQVSSGQSVTVPVITGSKFAGGGINTGNLGGNRIAPKSTGGGGGGKKGGGGGGKAVKPPKKADIKKDPYHDVNDQLKEVDHNLKKLQKEEKKLTGKEYLQNLIKQNQQLEKQRRLVGRKADIAQAQMSERLASMQRDFGNIFSVDSEGYLTNYVELQKEAARQVEAAWQQANKSPSEENNQRYEYAKERYDKLTKAMDDYTKEVETFWKMAEEDQELVNQLIENNIKRFNYTIDLHLDTAEFEQDWKEFRRDVLKGIKEDDYVNLSGFGLSMAKDDLADSKELVSHIKEIQTAITNMNKGKYNLSPYHDDFASAYADLRKYTEELMKKGEDIADVQKEIKDNWMDAIDDAQDVFDEQLDDYGQINDLIEHNLDMLEMLHGDEAYEQAARLYQQQANNSKQQLDFLKRETDFWKQQMDSAERGSDAWKEYKKNWEDSLQEMNKTVEDAADYFYKKYEATFNKLIKQMKDVFAGGDWNKRQTAWEDYLDEDDRYLDSLSRANGTYNVILKAQQAIGDASLKNQKELNKWLEATKDNLEGQTELRQIDLDIAEKELDIILKRQALEDAQNNKTKMRLRRDSQGNYRYQYVADTNKVAEAQQELRDAIEDLRLLVKDDFKDTVGRMYDQIDEFAKQAAEIAEKYGFESTEFAEGMADLQERYINKTTKTANDLAEMLTKLTQTTGVEATVLFDQMGDEFQAALGMNSETFAVFKEMFAPGGQYVNMIDGFVSSIYTGALSAMPDQVQDAFNGMTNLLPSAVADLGGNLQERIRGIFEAFQSDMSDAQSQYNDDISGLASQTGENFNDLTTSMESNITATQNLLTTNGKLIDSYGSVIETLESLSGEMDKVMDQYRDLSEATVNNTAKTFLSNGYYQNGTTGVGQTDYGISNFDSQYANIDSISQALYLLSGANNFNLNDGTVVDGSGLSVSGLDAATSGYINYIQQIGEMAGTNSAAYSQLLNDYAQTISDQMGNLLNSIGMSNIMNLLTHASGDIDKAIEQAITINADFPNAESAAEIRQALEELINLASQRASGTRRTY